MNTIEKIRENVSKVMVGREQVTDLILAALAAGGHVLLEDMPGTGKTVLAKALAASMSFDFGRIQFTPDLLPSDVTRLYYFDQSKNEFLFRAGPVFTNLLLADEINRATPRTQSALLECMGEKQVTIDGKTRTLEDPFVVIATQNPVETLGCFPLPEAQLDRFLMKLSMGSMSPEQEVAMIDRFITDEPLETLESVADREQILSIRQRCRQVYVHRELREYIAAIAQASRQGSAMGGISPRGTLSLLRSSQGYALVQGRDYVVPEDIREVSGPVLAHRLIGAESERQAKEMVRNWFDTVEVPTEDWKRA